MMTSYELLKLSYDFAIGFMWADDLVAEALSSGEGLTNRH